MTHMTVTHAPTISTRVAGVAALIGGVVLVVDIAIITAVNSSFGLFDDILFYTGLAGLLVALVALAAHLSSRSEGARRVAIGVMAFLALFLGTAAFSFVMDAMGRRVFSEANVGLHGEWSFFSVGIVLLLFAGWALRQR